MPIRNCGECVVCCEQVTVTETLSPAGEPCKFQSLSACGSCTVHRTDLQPSVCKSFNCAWVSGCGPDREAHRPDQCGVMFYVGQTPTGLFGFAMEYKPAALLTTARVMLVEFAANIPYPIIVRSEYSKPPYDYGDAVVIRKDLYVRCAKRLAGPMRTLITQDLALFDLVIEIPASPIPSTEIAVWQPSR